jgi:hypothetical protein
MAKAGEGLTKRALRDERGVRKEEKSEQSGVLSDALTPKIPGPIVRGFPPALK